MNPKLLPPLNQKLVALAPHPSKKISDSIRGRTDVLDLTVGVPDYGPPTMLHDKLAELLAQKTEQLASFHRYADSKGVRELRVALAERYRRRYNLVVDPDSEILITHGGAEAIWLTIFTLTDVGDEVLLPDPCYMLYEPIVLSLDRKVVRVTGGPDFIIRPEHILPLLTPRTRLLLLNSPENPTGVVYEREDLRLLAEFGVAQGFRLMHDEVFDDHLFEGTHVPLMEVTPSRDHIVMVNSFSKRFGMTGWRLGWLVAAPEVLKQAAKAHTYVSLATGALLQDAMVDLINDPQIDAMVQGRISDVAQKAWSFAAKLRNLPGFRLDYQVKGGFYLFPNIVDLMGHPLMEPQAGETSGETVARALLAHCKIAVVPGIGFGPSGANHVRISIAGPREEQDEALRRLEQFLSGIG